MSMIGVLPRKIHAISKTGDFVELGVLHKKTEALHLRIIEENEMMQRIYNGVIVFDDNKEYKVLFQDFTWIRYKSAGYRCAVFQKKKCMLGRDEKCWNMTR